MTIAIPLGTTFLFSAERGVVLNQAAVVHSRLVAHPVSMRTLQTDSGRMPHPGRRDCASIPANQLRAVPRLRGTAQNRFSFEAFDVSGSESGDYFQVQLSRKKEDPLTFSFKNYNGTAPYLLIQRDFENEDDEHWYVETHRPEMSGHCRWIQVSVRGDTLHAKWHRGEATVRMHCSEQELQEFMRVLRIIVPGVRFNESVPSSSAR